jgi:hypothetical protein
MPSTAHNFGIALPGEQWADGFVAGIEMRRDAPFQRLRAVIDRG